MLFIPLVILAFFLARFAKASGRNVSPIIIWILSIIVPIVCGGAVNAIFGSSDQPAWPYNIIAYFIAIIGVILFVVYGCKKAKTIESDDKVKAE